MHMNDKRALFDEKGDLNARLKALVCIFIPVMIVHPSDICAGAGEGQIGTRDRRDKE